MREGKYWRSGSGKVEVIMYGLVIPGIDMSDDAARLRGSRLFRLPFDPRQSLDHRLKPRAGSTREGRPKAAFFLRSGGKLRVGYFETLLQGLVHAKILRDIPGPGGDYELTRERGHITVGEIVRVAMSLTLISTSRIAPGTRSQFNRSPAPLRSRFLQTLKIVTSPLGAAPLFVRGNGTTRAELTDMTSPELRHDA
jgi:hypothetical protein